MWYKSKTIWSKLEVVDSEFEYQGHQAATTGPLNLICPAIPIAVKIKWMCCQK